MMKTLNRTRSIRADAVLDDADKRDLAFEIITAVGQSRFYDPYMQGENGDGEYWHYAEGTFTIKLEGCDDDTEAYYKGGDTIHVTKVLMGEREIEYMVQYLNAIRVDSGTCLLQVQVETNG